MVWGVSWMGWVFGGGLPKIVFFESVVEVFFSDFL